MEIEITRDGAFRNSMKGKIPFAALKDDYDQHQLFLVTDGQDIYGKQIDFIYFEVGQYIARMIPQRLWNNKSEKLNLYERLMISAPAYVIQKQMLKEFLNDVS